MHVHGTDTDVRGRFSSLCSIWIVDCHIPIVSCFFSIRKAGAMVRINERHCVENKTGMQKRRRGEREGGCTEATGVVD